MEKLKKAPKDNSNFDFVEKYFRLRRDFTEIKCLQLFYYSHCKSKFFVCSNGSNN